MRSSWTIRTDDPAGRFAPGKTLRGKPSRGGSRSAIYVVESVREHAGRLLVRLAGVADRNGADALRGTLFLVDTAELPPIDDPDEFYDHQLEGLRVRTVAGADVGVVAEVLHTAGGGVAVGEGRRRTPRCWCPSSARS